ncbi:substrate-binding domain-containing protein [Streptomyces sasae]|uniref:substrate-binding domain-containing protein n=1 Tax=Streptomyces sasae TaxID=1266772 RepID=UPI002931BEEE|nr:substrate-binding domain-containing protein [Streptomyces sasae]
MTARPATAATATTHRNRTVRISGALCAAALLTLTAAGCSKKSSDSTSAGSDSSSSSCGTVPAAKYNDTAGLIKALGSEYTAAYSGYSGTVQKSAWANWEGKKSGTITVGISESQLVNPYQTLINTALQKYLKAQGYKVIDLVSTNEVTNQISQFNQLITDKVDLIIYQPLAAGFESVVDKAAKAGIPSISVLNNVADANTVNVVPNAFAAGEAQAAALAKSMGGKGTILGVHGIKGVPIDTDTFKGAKAALAECSGITLDDSIYTDFSPTTAQTKVQQYLAANPTKTIGGVLEGGPMTTGIISAFQKSNVTVAPVADNGLTKGGVAYWAASQSSYKGVGLYNPADGLAQAVAQVAKHMLDGDGVKASDIVINPPLVTSDNLSKFSKSSFKTGDASTITVGDVGQTFAETSYIDGFFGS